MRAYIQRLATTLFATYGAAGRIGLTLQVEDVAVDLDTAMSCALILMELLSNALQHAFPAGQSGEVAVTWHADAEDQVLLRVRDTGVGLPPEAGPAQAGSIGDDHAGAGGTAGGPPGGRADRGDDGHHVVPARPNGRADMTAFRPCGQWRGDHCLRRFSVPLLPNTQNLWVQGEEVDQETWSHISLLPFKHVVPNGTYFIEDMEQG